MEAAISLDLPLVLDGAMMPYWRELCPMLDAVIWLDASQTVRLARLQGAGLSEEAAGVRLASALADEIYAASCPWRIDAGEAPASVRAALEAILRGL